MQVKVCQILDKQLKIPSNMRFNVKEVQYWHLKEKKNILVTTACFCSIVGRLSKFRLISASPLQTTSVAAAGRHAS